MGGGYRDLEFTPLDKEWGAVWRNVYRRNFLIENNILFNTSIKLNEDGMFNAKCFSYAKSVNTVMEAYYYYTIRQSGALSLNRGASLVSNKLALLEERHKIVQDLNNRGFDISIEAYAGSCVLSALELIIKVPYSSRSKVLDYCKHPFVRKAYKTMPFIRNIKFDIGLCILKLRAVSFAMLLLLLFRKVKICFKGR